MRGYQEPSRAKQTGQYKTRQDSPPGPDRQDRTTGGSDRQDRTSHNDRKALQGQTDKTSHNDRKALQGHTDKTGHLTTTGKPSRARQTKQDIPQRQESPPGPDRHDRTSHNDRKALQGQTDKTGHPTGTRSPPGLARRLRLLLGMTRSQGPSQGPSATASTSATRGQAARMASMATTRGAACPRRVSMDKTW